MPTLVVLAVGALGAVPLEPLTLGWAVDGDQAGANLYPAPPAGDVNGDGYDDVVVVSTFYSNGQWQEGIVWLFHGSPTGPAVNPDWTYEPNLTAARPSVSGVGDVNGDGFDDVVVAERLYDGAFVDSGRAKLFLGSATGLKTTAAWSVE